MTIKKTPREKSISSFQHTLHWTNSTCLEHQPGHLLNVLGSVRRIADLAVGIVFVGEVKHNGTTLKNALWAVGEGRDAAIGVNLQEPPRF